MSEATPKTARRFEAADGVVLQAVGDETVLLDLGSGVYYSLNGVASSVWRELQAGRTVAELVEALLDRYDVERERAAEDVRVLIDEAVEYRLLQAR